MIDPNNSLKEVSLVISILQVLGVFPWFIYVCREARIFQPKWAKIYMHLVLSAVTLAGFSILFLILGESRIISRWYTRSHTRNINQLMDTSLSVIASIAIAFNCGLNTKCQLQILKGLIDTVDEVNRIGEQKIESKYRNLMILEVVATFVNFITAYVTGFRIAAPDLVTFVFNSAYSMQMVYCNLNISFINRVCTITFSRLKYINNELGCRVRETGHSTKELVKLISRHSSLCEIIQHLNSCYGLVALICVAFSSYTITKDAFVISTLWELGFRIEALIRYTFWISLNLIYMTSLAASSGNIKNEVHFQKFETFRSV